MRVRLKSDVTIIDYRVGGPDGGEKRFFTKGTEGTVIGSRSWYNSINQRHEKMYNVLFDMFQKDTELCVDKKCVDVIDEHINLKSFKINKKLEKT